MDETTIKSHTSELALVPIWIVAMILFVFCCLAAQWITATYKIERYKQIRAQKKETVERLFNQMIRENARHSRHLYVLRGQKMAPSEVFDI